MIGMECIGFDNLMPHTLGETRFDFATFLAAVRGADVGGRCSIRYFGLMAANFR